MVAYKIGRGTANDIVVEDSSVSRCHAELRVSDEACVLVDLGSTNGTCVRENGRWIEIEKASVAHDERILLGEVVTTVTALIEKRNHEPKSLGVRGAPANEYTTPGRSGRDEALPEPARAQVFGEDNDHARLVGRRRRPGADRANGHRGERHAAPRREPEPPSRGPIVYSGIAARVNGTPDAGPDRPDPSIRRDRAAAAPAPVGRADSTPRLEAPGKQRPATTPASAPRSTPYLQVPLPAERRPAEPPAQEPPRFHTQSKWLAFAAVGGLVAITAVVTGMRYGSALVGVLGFGAQTRAEVVASAPARKAAPVPPAAATTAPADKGWQRFVGGPGNDSLAAGARYRDGGAILVGTTAAGLPPNPDLWAVRLDANGKVLWRRAFGSTNPDHGLAVAAAKDGGALVAGSTDGGATAWMLRLDDSGQKRWEYKIKIGARNTISAAVEVPDGGFAVLVVSRDAARSPGRTQLVRLDESGKETWRKPLHKEPVTGTDLLAIRDTGFAVAGTRGSDKPTLWVARLDRDGEVRWERTLRQDGRDSRAFLRLARRDDLIVGTTLRTGGQTETGGVLRLVRLDRDGDALWDHTVKARNGLRVSGLFLVKRGIIVAGIEEGETPWVARVDTAGALVWKRRFPDLKTGQANTIVERGRGRMLIAGRIDRSDARKQDGLLLFLDRDGRPAD